MICVPCRGGHHLRCREAARQNPALNRGLTAVELAGSSWCDCRHQARPVAPFDFTKAVADLFRIPPLPPLALPWPFSPRSTDAYRPATVPTRPGAERSAP